MTTHRHAARPSIALGLAVGAIAAASCAGVKSRAPIGGGGDGVDGGAPCADCSGGVVHDPDWVPSDAGAPDVFVPPSKETPTCPAGARDERAGLTIARQGPERGPRG